MTREEAKSCISTIEMLQRLAYNIHGVMDVIDADNCEKIIKALEQEPSGDLISRDELLRAIDTWDKFGVDDTNSLFRLDNLSLPHYVPYIHYDDVVKCIKGMPPAEQEPKIDVLDKIRERISLEKLGYPPSAGYYKAIVKVLQIIDKYRKEQE